MLAPPTAENLIKLIENPSSLNTYSTQGGYVLLSNAIRTALLSGIEKIENKQVKVTLALMKEHRDQLISFLITIKPLFPKFMNEMYSGTIVGFAESIIRLFQNSKSIRRKFKNSILYEVTNKLKICEVMAIRKLTKPLNSSYSMWECSSSQADGLKSLSPSFLP